VDGARRWCSLCYPPSTEPTSDSEFRGTITPDEDFNAFVKAREEYTALTSQR